ncbi:succinate-semialdehyde dehydrogenase I [Actinobacillus indolicus]|nr:succinate-semialdehyde dehydrogenase I [Actinobacillus indolicus]VTU09222.1 succinate-semialdehyde dehydrogenase I [Actinobacillus indolicus]
MQSFALLKTQAYINGDFIDALNNKTFAVTNPATLEEICQVADLGEKETEQAILAAEVAQISMGKSTA